MLFCKLKINLYSKLLIFNGNKFCQYSLKGTRKDGRTDKTLRSSKLTASRGLSDDQLTLDDHTFIFKDTGVRFVCRNCSPVCK